MSEWMDGFTPEQLALLAPLFAIALSEGLTGDEVAVFGAFLNSVGDLMALIGYNAFYCRESKIARVGSGGLPSGANAVIVHPRRAARTGNGVWASSGRAAQR